MPGADDLPLEAELVTQADVEASCQDHKPRRNFAAIGELDRLPVRAGRNVRYLSFDEFGAIGNLRANRIDQRVIENALLVARAPLHHAAEPRHPGFAIVRRSTQHRLGETGQAQCLHLRAVELLAAEIDRIDRVQIDQDGVDAGATEHRRRQRAGEATTHDDDIRAAHRHSATA